MDLLPTDEQDEIVASVRAVLAGRHTLGEPLDDALWSAAAEQGWFGLGLPEDLGGVGYSLVEEALLFVELGRAGVPGPFLATTIAAAVAARGGNADLAASLLSGEARAAWVEPNADGAVVLDGPGAAIGVTVGDDVSLVALADVERTTVPPIDEHTPVERIAAVPDAVATSTDEADLVRAGVLLAAQMAGIAEATTAQSVEYAKDREQFGQPIGGFQAVKHRCADMLVDVEGMRSTVYWAAWCIGADDPEASVAASTAKTWCSDASKRVMASALQVHGGIGFTWEHDLHFFMKRAQLDQLAFGDASFHRSRLAALLRPRVEAGESVV